METKWIVGLGMLAAALGGAGATSLGLPSDRWSAAEIGAIRSLWIEELEPLPADPTNRYGDDPLAASFGHRLFFDPRLSSNGQVACATCHVPELEFQDGTPLATGVGTTDRRTMPIAGTAYSPWQFWDGRKDSQWAQALGPLESPVEHGGTRAQYVHLVARHYRTDYEQIFGALPELDGIPEKAGPVEDPAARAAWERLAEDTRTDINRVYANIGKAIAAYERRIQFGSSRFDAYAAALVRRGSAPADILTSDEVAGLRLFIGKAECTNCHNGPLLTDNHFHNTGVPPVPGLPDDLGRASGAQQVRDDEFNCRGPYSDADPAECRELEFLAADGHELIRAFKTPTLRNVAERPPYMHAGQIATLGEVLRHYDRAPEASIGHSELRRLRLTGRELRQLEAFLRALSGPTEAPSGLLHPPM
jgi:cytochrome c peroxidase